MASRLEELKDLKALLWSSLVEVDADKRSPLAAQWRAASSEIAELEGEAPAVVPVGDPLDELRAKRKSRGA